MAKKKSVQTQINSEPAPEPAPVAPEAEKRSAYSTGSWAGYPLYQCQICLFNTLDQNAIDEHVEKGQHIGADVAADAQPEGEIIPSKHEATLVDMPDGQKLVGVYEIDLKEVDHDTENDIN